MSTDLETRLRSHFAEVAEATPVSSPPLIDASVIRLDRPPTRRPGLLAAAAAVALIAGSAIAYAVVHRSGSGTIAAPQSASLPWTGTVPAGDPVLFWPTRAPAKQATTSLVSDVPGSEGALISPAGNVIHVSLYGSAPVQGDGMETRSIGGVEVTAVVDSSNQQRVYYWVESGCLAAGWVTTDLPRWDPTATALAGAVTLASDRVDLAVPAGWTSLGVATGGEEYSIQFGDDADSTTIEQRPNAPIGVFMRYSGTPTQFDLDGQPAWTFQWPPSARTTLITSLDGTAIEVAGKASVDELADIVRSLTRAPRSAWTDRLGTDGATQVTYAPLPAGCTVPPLDVTIGT